MPVFILYSRISSRIWIISSTSFSVIISGGTKRITSVPALIRRSPFFQRLLCHLCRRNTQLDALNQALTLTGKNAGMFLCKLCKLFVQIGSNLCHMFGRCSRSRSQPSWTQPHMPEVLPRMSCRGRPAPGNILPLFLSEQMPLPGIRFRWPLP